MKSAAAVSCQPVPNESRIDDEESLLRGERGVSCQRATRYGNMNYAINLLGNEQKMGKYAKPNQTKPSAQGGKWWASHACKTSVTRWFGPLSLAIIDERQSKSNTSVQIFQVVYHLICNKV